MAGIFGKRTEKELEADKRKRNRKANVRRGHLSVEGTKRIAKEAGGTLSYPAQLQLRIFIEHMLEKIGENAAAITSVKGNSTITLASTVTAASWMLGKSHCKSIRNKGLEGVANHIEKKLQKRDPALKTNDVRDACLSF